MLNGIGIYGSITGISATMVATFIIFGAFIEGSGIGRLFHNVGMRVAGRYSGGPAKVEVISSSLFGTISGSSVANVYATGSFTIPAMIKLGYQRHFAAGVETAASVGGQIMPPVMGAGAFVMAEMTNIPYAKIAIGAILGAICYFFMILISVHLKPSACGWTDAKKRSCLLERGAQRPAFADSCGGAGGPDVDELLTHLFMFLCHGFAFARVVAAP